MFKVLRYYSIASLLSIAAAGVLLAVVYRTVAIQGLAPLAESSNLALANMVLFPLRPAIEEYLAEAGNDTGREDGAAPLPPALDRTIGELLKKESRIARINFFNREGRVSFSTQPDQIGSSAQDNPRYAAAMNGRVTAQLIYHGLFSSMGQFNNNVGESSKDDNVVHSYIPIRRAPDKPVLGVFEVYTDVGPQVRQVETAALTVLASATLIFAVLYGVLLLVVRHARDVINMQHEVIQKKNVLLAQLSESKLRREELERKRLASELHEGLAQTLTAIKLDFEIAHDRSRRTGASQLPISAVVPGLQAAIQQTRTIATDLHPSSLDDLGLVPAIDGLCREFAVMYPWVRVKRAFDVWEESIPTSLRIVIYRIIETALRIIAHQRTSDEARITVEMQGTALTLIIDAPRPAETPGPPVAPREIADSRPDIPEYGTPIGADTQWQLGSIRERTVLTGGRLRIEDDGSGGARLIARWQIDEGLPSEALGSRKGDVKA